MAHRTRLVDPQSPYLAGERQFIELEVEENPDFAGADRDRAIFDGTFLHGANFRGCKLRGASFRDCNLKCSDFRESDLRGAVFVASLECSRFAGAKLAGASFGGSSYYSYILKDGELPLE